MIKKVIINMNKLLIKKITIYGFSLILYILILSGFGVFGDYLESILWPLIKFSLKWFFIISFAFFIIFVEKRIEIAINKNKKVKEILEIKKNPEEDKLLLKDRKKMKKYKFNEANI